MRLPLWALMASSFLLQSDQLPHLFLKFCESVDAANICRHSRVLAVRWPLAKSRCAIRRDIYESTHKPTKAK